MKTIEVNDWKQVPKNFTGVVKWSNGSKYWYKNGEWHREDGPAVERSDGTKCWYLENEAFNYAQINMEDYVVLDHYKGDCGVMWYKFLDKDRIFEYPDIPGLIRK